MSGNSVKRADKKRRFDGNASAISDKSGSEESGGWNGRAEPEAQGATPRKPGYTTFFSLLVERSGTKADPPESKAVENNSVLAQELIPIKIDSAGARARGLQGGQQNDRILKNASVDQLIFMMLENRGANADSIQQIAVQLADSAGAEPTDLECDKLAAIFERANSLAELLAEHTGKRSEPALATGRSRKLRDADFAKFKVHAEANPWIADSGVAPSAHILKHFEHWFEKGLGVDDIRAVQADLAQAYKSEVLHNTRKRIAAITGQHKLSPGTPKKAFRKVAAELSYEELEERRLKAQVNQQNLRKQKTNNPNLK